MATPELSAEPLMASPARRVSLARRIDTNLPYLLLAPAGIFLAIFFALPMVQALVLAVQTNTGDFTLDHFQRMVKDVNFADALRNTLLLITVAVPLQFVLAIVMGLLI